MKITYTPKKKLSNIIKSGFARLVTKLGKPDVVMRALLKNTHLFDQLTLDQFDSLIKAIRIDTRNCGEVIIKEGDVAENFYLIRSGAVRIYTHSVSNDTEIVLARLEAGDYFGEQALLDESPGRRTASAKIVENAVLYVIPHAIYSTILHAEIKDVLKKIGKLQLFEMLQAQLKQSGTLQNTLLQEASGKMIKYKEGDIVFEMQTHANQAYFIVSGRVVVEITDEAGKVRITELSSGQLFGELGVLKNNKRVGTAKAKGEVVVFALEAEAFKKMHETSPELQELVNAMENFYCIKHYGVVKTYYSIFLDMPAMKVLYKLENGKSVTAAKVIGKPIFTMSLDDIKDTTTLRYQRGRTVRRELLVKDNRILGVMSLGEWEDLAEACDFVLTAKVITAQQIQLFTLEGVLNTTKVVTTKSISAEEHKQALCLCMQVSKGQIYDAIRSGLNKVEEVSEKTGAGTVCGNCRPKIVELLGLRAWTTVNIINVLRLRDDVCSFRLQLEQPFTTLYKPGQNIVIQGLIDNQLISRNYTLTSVAGVHDFIEITVKKEPKGYFSSWLFLHAKDTPLLRVSEPQGNFILSTEDTIPVVCLVGGIGVTPALAFARFFSLIKQTRRLHIDYSSHTHSEFILLNEWEKIILAHKNITITLRATRDQGILNADHIAKIIQDFSNADFYICGPRAYEKSVTGYLKESNIPPNKIKTEQFIHAGSPIQNETKID